MGKILHILIIENRDLAHAQTFCKRVPLKRGLAEQTWTSNRNFDDKALVTWFMDVRKSRQMPKNLNRKVFTVEAYTWASLR